MPRKIPGRAFDSNTAITINNISFSNTVAINATAILVGNSTVNTFINATSVTTTALSGNGANVTSVDAATLGGNTASTLRSYSDTVSATAFTNAASRADSAYSNAASYADTKAATAYSNATSYADTVSATAFTNAASRADAAYSNAIAYSGNAVQAYNNAVAYAASNTYVNNTFLPLAGGTLTGALTINSTANVVSNLAANNVTIRGDIQIDGNLVVSGTSVTLNAASLAVEDNMIYLNNGSQVTHPDLGFAGNYNDGTYKHAGFFRDATDATWKVFDGYTPEPDASAYIDTSNASFRIANFTANVITANSFSGNGASVTSVDAATVGGNTASTLRSYSDTVAATAFSNAAARADSAYSNATSYAATIAATAYSNASSYADTKAAAAYSNAISYSGNAALAYSNAITYSANATNLSSGTVAFARLPALYLGTTQIQSSSAAQAVSGITTLAAGNTTITGFANISSTLQVTGVSTLSANLNVTGYQTVTQDIRSSGQIRAAGWYNNAAASSTTSMAVEIGTSSGVPYIIAYNRDTSAYGPIIFNANSFTFTTQGTQNGTTIANSSATHAFFASNGNVGVGTSTPGYKLHVGSGLTKVADGIVDWTDSNSKFYSHLCTGNFYGATGVVLVNTNIPGHNQSGNGNMFVFRVTGYWYDSTNGGAIDAVVGCYAGESNFYNPTITGTIPNAWINNVTVYTNPSGKVSIGFGTVSTSQSCYLAVTDFVQGFSNVNESYAQGWTMSSVTSLTGYTNATSLLYRTTARYIQGNVGIGNTSPSHALSVKGDARIGSNGQRFYVFDDGNAHVHSTSGPMWLNAEDNSVIYINNQYNGDVVLTNATGKVGIGNTSPITKLHVQGNVYANGTPVQVQYTSSGTRTSVNSTSFTEPSTNYRVAITPKSTASMIKITYFIPMNPGADYATNTIYSLRAFRIIGGSTSYALTSAGGSNGSRNVFAGITVRPVGYDLNDPMTVTFTVIDFPNTTSTCTYGFDFKRETGGNGTVYFGYSAGDSSNWGFDTDILIIAEEIGQ